MTEMQAEQQATGLLVWQVWPAAQCPALSIVIALGCLALSFGAMWSLENGWYAFITLAVLTLALSPHYFPTAYQLDDEGVSIRSFGNQIQRPWSAFRLAIVLPDRVVLSPLSAADRWLARRRSVELRFQGNQTQVIDFVQKRVQLREAC